MVIKIERLGLSERIYNDMRSTIDLWTNVDSENETNLYGLGWIIGDMPYHLNDTEEVRDMCRREKEYYCKICKKVDDLKNVLLEYFELKEDGD